MTDKPKPPPLALVTDDELISWSEDPDPRVRRLADQLWASRLDLQIEREKLDEARKLLVVAYEWLPVDAPLADDIRAYLAIEAGQVKSMPRTGNRAIEELSKKI